MLDRLLSHDRPRSRLLALALIVVFVALAVAPFVFPGAKALSVAVSLAVFERARVCFTQAQGLAQPQAVEAIGGGVLGGRHAVFHYQVVDRAYPQPREHGSEGRSTE